jgi:hypothetical protein
MTTTYNRPSIDKYVNPEGDMYLNGQYDEIIFEWYIEDNPHDPEGLLSSDISLYHRDLIKNYKEKQKINGN